MTLLEAALLIADVDALLQDGIDVVRGRRRLLHRADDSHACHVNAVSNYVVHSSLALA